jgi:hypothetical protein
MVSDFCEKGYVWCFGHDHSENIVVNWAQISRTPADKWCVQEAISLSWSPARISQNKELRRDDYGFYLEQYVLTYYFLDMVFFNLQVGS